MAGIVKMLGAAAVHNGAKVLLPSLRTRTLDSSKSSESGTYRKLRHRRGAFRDINCHFTIDPKTVNARAYAGS